MCCVTYMLRFSKKRIPHISEIDLVAFALLFLLVLGCAKGTTKGPVKESGLLGVWALSTLHGKAVVQIAQPDEEFPPDPSANNLLFEMKEGQLVFSGKTGMAMIERISRNDDTITLDAFYDERARGGKLLRRVIVVHLVNANTIYFEATTPTEGVPSISSFYHMGSDTLYARVK